MTRPILTPEQLRALGGEQLRREAKIADAGLHHQINRMRELDATFDAVLAYALLVEAEQERRKWR